MKNYNFRFNQVIGIGDTHSMDVTWDILKHPKLPEGVDVVHIGDGGYGFGNPAWALDNTRAYLQNFNKTCIQKDINLYLLLGNHDNTALKTFPNLSNVFIVQTGDTGTFPNGNKTLFVNGGISLDRFTRKEGESYWRDEATEILEHVEKTDYMFSHDTPEEFNHSTAGIGGRFQWYVDRDPTLMEDCYAQRANMTRICKESGARFIMYGHFHNSVWEEVNGVVSRCLTINEVWEFNAEKY